MPNVRRPTVTLPGCVPFPCRCESHSSLLRLNAWIHPRHRPCTWEHCKLQLARLKIIAGNQSHLPSSIVPVKFGAPPAVILVTNDGKYVTLFEAQLFGDGSLIRVHCPCCFQDTLVGFFFIGSVHLAQRTHGYRWFRTTNSPKCKIGWPSRVYCREGSATLRLRGRMDPPGIWPS